MRDSERSGRIMEQRQMTKADPRESKPQCGEPSDLHHGEYNYYPLGEPSSEVAQGKVAGWSDEPSFQLAQCTETRHIWNTDGKKIVGDKCRCGKGKPIKRMT